MSTVVAKWSTVGTLVGIWALAGSALAAVPERSGERVIGAGERLELWVPDEPGDFLLRFTETGIDLELSWSLDGRERLANAPGRRWGEQVLLLPTDSPRPARVTLSSVLAQAPSGRVSWQWQSVDAEFSVLERRALALESAAAELAAEGGRPSSEQALQLYRQALELQRQAGNRRWIDLSYRVGQLHSRLGNWPAAESIYLPALAEVDSARHSTVSRLSDGLGFALYRQGKHELAKPQFDRALSAAAAAGDAYQYALSSNNSCLLLHAQGDMRAAVDCLRKADRAYVAAGIVEQRGPVLINLGATLNTMGQREEALEILQQALFLQQPITRESRPVAAHVRLHLAWTLLDGGRFGEALEHALQGQVDAVEAEHYWLIGQLARVSAAVLSALGETERARSQLQAVLSEAHLLAAVFDPARLRYAAAQLETDDNLRLRELVQARTDAAATGDDFTYVRAWIDEGQLRIALGDRAAGIEAALGALAMARRLALAEEEVKALAMLADLDHSGQGSLFRQRALTAARSAHLREEEFWLMHAQARAEVQVQRWTEARRLVEQADAVMLDLRQRLSPDEFFSFRARIRQFASGYLAGALLDPAMDDAAKAEWLWQRLQAQRGWTESLGGDSGVAGPGFFQLRELLADDSNSELDHRGRSRAELLRRELEMPERLTVAQPWPSLRQMVAEAGGGDALLVLLLDEPNSAAVVARADSVTVHALAGELEIELALKPVLRGLARQDPLGEGAMRARLAYLGSFFGEPLDDLDDVNDLGFVPGPGLEQFPIELLPAGLFSAAAITRYSISATQPALGAESGGRGRIVILDPEVSPEAGYSGNWVGLPAVESEIGRLKSLLDEESYVHRSGSQAASTLSRLGDDGPLRLLHVAGHAVAHRQWSSLDLLAFGDGPDQQVPLGVLRRQRLQVGLVVLSACRTALGGRGETGLSFAQGFLAGGSSQVLASAWSVDDRATAEFMQHFYQAHLSDGVEPERALQTAQERMRVQARWRAPYWWAGFQLWKGLPAATQASALAGHARVAARH